MADDIVLFCKEGSSDKQYQLQIVPEGDLFCVNFQYGKRGAPLKAGTKTPKPVDRETAERTFRTAVTQKKAKGYTESEDGTAYAGATDKQVSGIKPQLLCPIDDDELEHYLTDPDFCMEEKLDGENRLVRTYAGAAEGINKLGIIVPIPQKLVDTALRFGESLVPGEQIGDDLYVYDLLAYKGTDLRELPYRERYVHLLNAIASTPSHHENCFVLVGVAWTEAEKRAMLAKLRKENAEGVVFKDANAPYTPGRPNSGGPQVKYKFWASATCHVLRQNNKRSVAIGVYRANGELYELGNVTIPVNKDIPEAGAFIEVRYLYCFPDGGKFHQPIYIGPRNDVTLVDCRESQLKYKRKHKA